MMGKREQFGRKFIFLTLGLWFGTEVLFSSTIERIFVWKTADLNDQMAVVILIMLMIQIAIFQQYTLQELITIGICSLPIILATINSNYNRMLSTWIFIIAAKYIDFDKVIKLAYYVELALTFFVIYLFAYGFIAEVTLYRGSILRHSLGFSHPNQLGIRIFLLIVCRCYIRAKKFNIFDLGIIVAAAFFVYRVANSKTSFYALIILAIIMALYEFACIIGADLNRYSSLMVSIAIIVNLLSVFLSCINTRKNPMLNAFDRFMSRRFSNCHKTLSYYGFTLFGQEIKLLFTSPGGRMYHFWLDNAYMSMILRYGIIVFLLFSSLYIMTMLYLRKTGQHLLVAIMCLYAIYGIMENNFFSMSQNIFLLLLSYPIFKRNEVDIMHEQPKAKFRLTW